MKYKVGDQVKVVKSNNTDDWFDVEEEEIVGKSVEAREPKEEDQYLVKIVGYCGIYDDDAFAFRDEHLELVESTGEEVQVVQEVQQQDTEQGVKSKQKVKSDGGSSSYYFSPLPDELIDEIVEKRGIELKDVVKYCFYNDADVKDITKAIKRIMEDLRGGGKEGIDAFYDMNKIEFFLEEFKKSVCIQKRLQNKGSEVDKGVDKSVDKGVNND